MQYQIGDICYASDGNTFTCPKCNGEVTAIKKIVTLGWRCVPCADSKTEVPHNGGAIALGRVAPLARELYCEITGESYTKQVVEGETESLPRENGNVNLTKFRGQPEPVSRPDFTQLLKEHSRLVARLNSQVQGG